MSAYADATSCTPGGMLRFTLLGPGPDTVTVHDASDDRPLLTADVNCPVWTLTVPEDWPSSLYRAVFKSRSHEVYFVVRRPAGIPSAAILVSVPFATWQAYNRSGIPGESLYYAEEPTRAARVSFDRPGGGPPPERWEDGLLRWLGPAGYRVDYCSNLDLHADGTALLRGYRLLVVNGHDEYWSKEMRDAVESFTAAGGNVAYFAANTAFWQVRFEDGARTMVCYRDPVRDPVAALDPARTTVEWAAAPVHRPENTMTGVGYRHGAGAWGDFMDVMKDTDYTARFADHWVFAGTGLRDGDRFALGAVGYETDAALYQEVDGVPRITGGDGTPPSFVILATADLRHWRRYGQGGHATMGVFRLGAGTVFNAATVNWGNTLADGVVDRITRNVLDRLSAPPDPSRWDAIGPVPELTALVACEHAFWALTPDGTLLTRTACAQNLRWHPVLPAPSQDPPVCLAAPREAVGGMAIGLYAVTRRGRLLHREPVREPAPWQEIGTAPDGVLALASADGSLFAVTEDDRLRCLPLARLAVGDHAWPDAGDAEGALALTAAGGLLFAVDRNHRLRTRMPTTTQSAWTDLGPAGDRTVIAGYDGHLAGAGGDGLLRWRDIARA
ncbi:N,N-dimethylformamidase beta subunit family domain-containing protein [Dactylosporangium sp. NPDC051484]|uniref:N,N-dimethylformamidase beta subunit family domain-containing protein n=1 Tax=Dactylosporangium sp. NPDC051484 TaxID=3154942 RepID=UPI00344CDCC0